MASSKKQNSQSPPSDSPEIIADIIARSLGKLSDAGATTTAELVFYNENLPPGRFDFDLAEFPVFRLCKNRHIANKQDPLVYQDQITGKDGELVTRTWTVTPSAIGFGSASTQELLYDLLQLYVEQGLEGNHIQFGTLRSLFLRRGNRNPSKHDYERMIRDINILRGLDFHAENAFWDNERKAYVSHSWRLFNEVFYFRERATSQQAEMPFGFIEVSSTLRAIARTRGFFAIGFPSELFYQLKPLEQRLSLYLAKRFRYEKLHRRFVNDLAKALPIEAEKPANVRIILKGAAQGLLDKKVPILGGFSIEKNPAKQWTATFHRKEKPRENPLPETQREPSTPEIEELTQRLIKASGQPEDWRWWRKCAQNLGRDGVLRALGQFAEKRQLTTLRNPPAMLTAILKDIARQMKVSLQ